MNEHVEEEYEEFDDVVCLLLLLANFCFLGPL